jgi:hypothetical protein
MPFLFERAYRRMGRHYFLLYVVFEFVSAFVVCLATLGLFALYTDPSASEFWTIAAFAEACVLLSAAIMMRGGAKRVRPIIAWMQGQGDAYEAWRAAVEVPRELTLRVGWQPFLLIGVPVSVFATIEADLARYNAFIIFAGTAVAVAYSAILHFFSYEQFLRPVIEDIVRGLPAQFTGAPVGVPLRWKLLGALPLINVITGVVVSGLSTDGHAELHELGLDVVIAVLVAFTISLEQVPRGRLVGRVRGARAAERPRRSRRGGGTRRRRRTGGKVRPRTNTVKPRTNSLRHRGQLRSGRGGLGGRRGTARVRGDWRSGQRRRARGAPHAGYRRRRAAPRPRAACSRATISSSSRARVCAERRVGTCADLRAAAVSGQKFE